MSRTGSSDVIAAANIARDNNVTIAASGGRHWTINARSAASGLTVDLSQLRGVTVDPLQLTAVVEGKHTYHSISQYSPA